MTRNVILAATDFSDTSGAAVDWAVGLARALGATLVVAHFFDLPIVGFPDAAFLVTAKTAARLSNEAQALLDAEIARLRATQVHVEGVLKQSDARTGIPELAAASGARLVVVGSHGRTGLTRALVGSVAETILRASPVPVTVVRKHDDTSH
jgi:nucleotide-binding universal stress UspA family protein